MTAEPSLIPGTAPASPMEGGAPLTSMVAALGQLAEGVILTDADGRITFVNDAAARLHGVARLGVVPEEYTHTYRLLTVDGRPYPPEELPLARAALRGETVVDARWRIRRPDGTELVATGCANPVLGPEGARIGAVLTLRDDTARQAAETALEERTREAHAARIEAEAAEARLRDVFEQAPVAVAVLTGPDHVYAVVSPLYAQSPGTGRPLLGRTMREAFPEIAETGYIETMDRVYETGEPYYARERQIFLEHPGEGGGPPVQGEHFFNVGYQPLRDSAGRVYAIASVAYDVTEQVAARREIEAAGVEAERQRAAAQAANSAKSQFLSTMSHELRTPLNAIAGYTELLTMGLRGPLTDAQRQDLERIRRASQHLMGLVTDVLNLARVDAGQIEYHLADVELGEVLGDLEPLIAPQLETKNIAYSHDGCASDTPGEPHLVRVDPEKLRQILLNLLTNAMKFTDAGGRITLACETDRDTGAVDIHVSDTGRGIPPDQLERIFEPFVQVDRHRTHESQQGVGLGLSISRELARGMGGDLTAASDEGLGSIFTVRLQGVSRAAESDAGRTASAAPTAARSRDGAG